MINLNPLSYFVNQPREQHKRENIPLKESPTLLVVRLTRYRISFSCYPQTQIFFLAPPTVQTVPPLYCVPLAPVGVVVVVVVGRKRDSLPSKENKPLSNLG